jgi:hypothetical protein
MRDPRRIDRMLQQLELSWHAFPDMRLGQLLLNITRAENASVLWTLEDDQIEQLLDSFLKSKVFPEGLRYVKRRWSESRGDQHDGFGHSLWFFEIDPACNVIRQIEEYDDGTIRGYSLQMPRDDFGGLSTVPLDDSLADFEFIIAAEFNELWKKRTNK